jgi:hypothetical protein
MTSDSVIALAQLLNGLAERARDSGDNKPNLTPAIGLVNDLGRLVAWGPEADLRLAQAAVAGVREQLNVGEHAVNTPRKALENDLNARSYLAGALWAVNEVMTARLELLTATKASGPKTRRAQVRKMVLTSLLAQPTLSPTAIRSTINGGGLDARPDEVSRVVGELLNEGLVDSAQPAGGADRRVKQVTLTEQGRQAVVEDLGLLCAGSAHGT